MLQLSDLTIDIDILIGSHLVPMQLVLFPRFLCRLAVDSYGFEQPTPLVRTLSASQDVIHVIKKSFHKIFGINWIWLRC